MSEIPNRLVIRSDESIDYTDKERDSYVYSYFDVLKAAKKIKVANNTKLSSDVEERARLFYRDVQAANNGRLLNLPEFNYALNTLVRTPQ